MFFSGIVTITTSPRWAASVTETGVAPVSTARSATFRASRVSYEYFMTELTETPSKIAANVPAPIIPMFISAPFQSINQVEE